MAADAIVMPGDIGIGVAGLEWARQAMPNSEIIFVPGNHEYYHGDIQQTEAEMAEAAQRLGIHYLQNSTHRIGDVQFIGATLWTDFQVFGLGDEWFCLDAAKRQMRDFTGLIANGPSNFTVHRSRELHQKSLAFIERELAFPAKGKRVVVTHHAPSLQSSHPRFQRSLLVGAFASSLEHVATLADLWLHAHMHDPVDYLIGECRVYCNPRGYVSARGSERASWTPELVEV